MTTNPIVEALRAKFKTPAEVLNALGLDEALLRGTKAASGKKGKGAVAKALKAGIKANAMAEDADIGDLIELLDALKKTEQGSIGEIDAALSEAEESGEPEHEEEGEKEEEPAVPEKDHGDEFEDDKPEPAKEEKMAGLTPEPGAGASPAKEDEMKPEVAHDDPATKLHSLLEGKLSPEEMEQVGAILAELAGAPEGADEASEEEPAEDEECAESKALNKEDGPKVVTGGKSHAMDAKSVQIAVDAAIKAERARSAAIDEAKEAVRPYVGAFPSMSFDSASQVYQHALDSLGVNGAKSVKDIVALKIILKSQPLPGSERRSSVRLGMDAKASDSFFTRFPGAKRISA